ncbi:MAG: acyl-CoA reductase [Methanomassiliicoccus sp.]|nr:acyl-CoA reductase [Methanomassiliicoccus sp.]
MVRCHLLDGRFVETDLPDLEAAVALLEERRTALHALSVDDIIELLARLGKEMVRDPVVSAIEGASYMSLWLRRDNLERLLSIDLVNREALDRFCEVQPGVLMRAQPRGVSCHWLPNNVPTLSFFSLMLAVLTKNASVLKVSEVNRGVLTAVLKRLARIEVDRNGRMISGSTIVETVCMISFDSSHLEANEMMSQAADIKLAWGGSEAVRSVAALPQKDTCDILLFGPKYSLAVFDQAFLAREDLDNALKPLAMDVALFDQTACSSPQVAIVERGAMSAREFAEHMARCLETLPRRMLGTRRPEARCLDIINVRGAYLLSEDKDIVMPGDLGWTILIDQDAGLPEPVQGKCLFVREVGDLLEAAEWLTRRVQTVALCIEDPDRRMAFANKASYIGVDRFVLPGSMNDFALPWDGMLPLGRMVRWTTIRRNDNDRG